MRAMAGIAGISQSVQVSTIRNYPYPMHLSRSTDVAARLEFLGEVGSTNTELVSRASGANAEEWPDFSVLVSDNQVSGRGRLGRVWVTPAGKSLAISVLLRPRLSAGHSAGLSATGGQPLDLEHYGWLPLIAGVAMTTTVARLVPSHTVDLKWPNDVQIDGLKVSGLLAELLPDQSGVVMGAGLNFAFEQDELPTHTSTSLNLMGAEPTGLADAALAGYLTELKRLYIDFLGAGADPYLSGVAQQLDGLCSTLEQEVRVELPGGGQLIGTAMGIDSSGRLEVRDAKDGHLVTVAAGDVTHLRYE